ncbi:tetratricopeptide repeat protein [Aeoliella sp.]|uniref:tetratricopeptide repeat protein n=1 Tax=Aeoliella sp. TaxID=2795800 RepID=UPI003CCBD801
MLRVRRRTIVLIFGLALLSPLGGCNDGTRSKTNESNTLPLQQVNALIETGSFLEAAQLLSPCEAWLGDDSLSVEDKCQALRLLTMALQGSGNWAESTEVCLKIQTLPFDDEEAQKTASAKMHASLGESYRTLGEDDRAATSFRSSLELFEELGMTSTLDYWGAKNGEAVLLIQQGNTKTAKKLLTQVEAALSEASDSQPASSKLLLSKCLGNLGLIEKNEGSLSEAAIFYHRSIMLRSEVLGEEHSAMILPYYNLGMLHAANEDFVNAEVFVAKAVSIGERTWTDDNQQLVLMKRNLETIGKYLKQ